MSSIIRKNHEDIKTINKLKLESVYLLKATAGEIENNFCCSNKEFKLCREKHSQLDSEFKRLFVKPIQLLLWRSAHANRFSQ